MTAHFIADTVVHVTMVAVFVGIFFFTYATFIEKQVVARTTEQLTSGLMEEVEAWLTPTQNQLLMEQLQQLQAPDLTAADAAAKLKNDETLTTAIVALGALVIVGLIILLIVSKVSSTPINWKEVFVTNGIVLAATALVEFLFLTCLAQFYVPASLDDFKVTMYTTLAQWASS